MEMPVSHCVYPEISEEGDVRESAGRRTGDHQDAVPLQESRDYRRSSLCRSRTFVREYSAKDSDIDADITLN